MKLYDQKLMDEHWEQVRAIFAAIFGEQPNKMKGIPKMRELWERKNWVFPFVGEDGRIVMELDKSDEPLSESDLKMVMEKIEQLGKRFVREQADLGEVLGKDAGMGAYQFLYNRLTSGVDLGEVVENKLIRNREILPGKVIKAGTKFAKFIRQLIMIDDYEWYCGKFVNYNRDKADVVIDFVTLLYSQLISMLRDRPADKVVLSVNPVDILLASVHTTGNPKPWRSCHNLLDGEWRTGPVSYCLDETTLVSFAYRDTDLLRINGSDIIDELPRKLWRAMVYTNKDARAAVFSREYPDQFPSFAKMARKAMGHIYAEMYKIDPKWYVKNINSRMMSTGSLEENDPSSSRPSVHGSPWHYTDSPNTSIRMKDGGSMPNVYNGVEGLICPVCGYERTDDEVDSDELSCGDCFGEHKHRHRCNSCGDWYDEEDIVDGPDGEEYCENCFNEIFRSCDHCGGDFDRDDLTEVNGDNYVCPHCLENHYTKCEACDEYYNSDDIEEGPDGCSYCDDCYEDKFTDCDHCSSSTARDTLVELDGVGEVCPSCAEKHGECESCGSYYLTEELEMHGDKQYCSDCYAELTEQLDSEEEGAS